MGAEPSPFIIKPCNKSEPGCSQRFLDLSIIQDLCGEALCPHAVPRFGADSDVDDIAFAADIFYREKHVRGGANRSWTRSREALWILALNEHGAFRSDVPLACGQQR